MRTLVGQPPEATAGPAVGRGILAPTVLLLGLLGAAAGVTTVLVTQAVPGYTATDDPVISAVLTLGAGWAACLAGLAAWHRRRHRGTGHALVAAGNLWFVGQWAIPGAGAVFGGAAGPVFTAGLVTVAAAPVFVALLALGYPGGRVESLRQRWLVACGFLALVGLLGIGGTVFLDPSRHGCACPDNLLLLMDAPDLSAALSRLGFGVGAVWAASTVAVLVTSLVRDRSPVSRGVRGPVVVPAVAFLALTTVALVQGARRGFLPTSGVTADLRVGQAAALLVTSAGVTWGLLRARRVQAVLARAVVRWSETPGRQLRDDLADLLHDPNLVIAHRLDDGRVVGSDGAPLAPAAPAGREITELRVADDGSVLLVHRAGALDSPVLLDGLASAAGLALTNDRLRATTLDQVRALQTSQARIIEAGDIERRRLEQDLHDGAQQRLVGILLGLRLLRGRARSADAELQQAEAEVARAIDDLRDVSHGLFPAVLADTGLAAALAALGETRQVNVEAAPRDRLPAVVEATAYLVVHRAASGGPVTVDATHDGDQLTLRVEQRGPANPDSSWDRVVAVGGSLTVEPGQDGTGSTIVAVIPDGSTR